MYKKTIKAIICAATAGVCTMFSAASQATAWNIAFDPPDLAGYAILNVTSQCLATNGLQAPAAGCVIDLTLAHISLFGGAFHDYVPESGHVQVNSLFANNGFLTGLTTSADIRLESAPFTGEPPGAEDCDPLLSFFGSISLNPLTGSVGFSRCGTGGNLTPLLAGVTSISPASAIVVPEPGTLALLLGGAGAGWFVRRRKQAA